MNRIYPSFNGGSLEIAPTLPLNSELGPEAEKLKGGGGIVILLIFSLLGLMWGTNIFKKIELGKNMNIGNRRETFLHIPC